MKVEITIRDEKGFMHIANEHTIDPLRPLYTRRFFTPVAGLSGFTFEAIVAKVEPDADLLACLKGFMARLDTDGPTTIAGNPVLIRDLIRSSRTAIAKAEKTE